MIPVKLERGRTWLKRCNIISKPYTKNPAAAQARKKAIMPKKNLQINEQALRSVIKAGKSV